MKKILIVFILILIGSAVYFLYERYSYSDDLSYYPINPKNTKDKKTIKIGIIGDSWVSKGRFDWKKNMETKFLQNGINVEVITSSHPGATTKIIYENLFDEENKSYSSRFVVNARPDYCIVFAGVNDAAKHLTKEYYAEHYIKIIKTLIHYQIKPVVVELPKFGVAEDTELKNTYQKYAIKLVESIDTDGNLDNINEYRGYLQKELKENKLSDDIIFLRNPAPEYHKNPELYLDFLHLNHNGYQVLLENISKELLSYRPFITIMTH